MWWVVEWYPSEYSVCPCPLCWFYISFTPLFVRQDGLSSTLVYVGLRQFTFVGRDVELDNIEILRYFGVFICDLVGEVM